MEQHLASLAQATVVTVTDADHVMNVRKTSPLTTEQTYEQVMDRASLWMGNL